jgi:4-hydroxymandelate oxidase
VRRLKTRSPRRAPLPKAVNLFDFEALAQKHLPLVAWEYLCGGAGDEITLRRNRECLDAIRLKPRVLRDVSQIDTQLTLFDQRLDHPILLAPAAYHKVFHPQGEAAAARGAGAAGAVLVVSSFATVKFEAIAAAAKAPLWFQLYVQRDRAMTRELVQHAETVGCRVLCVTVDTPVGGSRNREMRRGFNLPPGVKMENVAGVRGGSPSAGHITSGDIYSEHLDPSMTWETIDWLRSFAKTPLILKGILTKEDARLALEHGAAGILVSNHGGRNLDTAPASIEALPGVVEAVAGRVPVLFDGGVRRGTDVVKALALGARAVMIGRPYLWGLAADGAEGVTQVVRLLLAEFRSAMALCGVTSLAQISPEVLWP